MYMYINLLLACLLAGLGSAQLQCEVPGACTDNIDVADTSADSYNECLAFCDTITDCLYFTYIPSLSACIAFSECGGISNETCPKCLTGEKGCPLQPEPQCNIPGWCEGNLVALSVESNANACLMECVNHGECTWYNYNSADRLCALNTNCVLYDPLRPDCVTGEVTCGPTYGDFDLLFVVGGENNNGNPTNDVEIVHLDASAEPCVFKPADYPYNVEGAVGSYIENYPHVCGGDRGNGIENSCYAYDPVADSWDLHDRLLMSRYRAAGVLMSEDHWWISGGLSAGGGNNYLAETEIYVDGSGVERYEDLPVPRERHSMLNLGDNKYFLSGGRGQQNDGSRTWIFDATTSLWTEQESASEDRDGEFAGVVTRADGTREVVVAGGLGLQSSEIFSLETMTWRAGPDLPQELWEGASVAYGNSFLLVGGQTQGNQVSNLIYRYDEVNDVFVQMTQTLATGRRYLTAMLIPDGYVDCAGKK